MRSWQEHANGNPMQVLFTKLKRLKPHLKTFNKAHFADISGRVEAKRRQLEERQMHNIHNTNERDLDEERNLEAELVTLEATEKSFYKQKVKLKWIQEGDMSTKFFHTTVAVQKKRNTIRLLIDQNGNKLEDFDTMAEEMINFHTKLIGTTDYAVKDYTVSQIRELLNCTLPSRAAEALTNDVSDNEIREALFR
ncbi:hypothetical protein V6N13_001111 [Hibiscus sabdariffa]